MINLINHFNRDRHAPLLSGMHADRKRLFVDRLKWDIRHDGLFERDEFDNDEAAYLVLADRETQEHQASVRLLRTDRPHILGNIFPELCEIELPAGPEYTEITRLCYAPRTRRAERIRYRNLIGRSLIEYAHFTGLRGYTLVTEMALLGQILSAGWSCRPLGLPRDIGGSTIGALLITIEPWTLRRMSPSWQTESVPMRVVEFGEPLAA